MNEPVSVIIQAVAVLTGTGRTYSPGTVAIRDGRIADVGDAGSISANAAEFRSFSNGVIIPGLVNAHCHLDLSFLRKPLSFHGSFVEWLMKVGWARTRASEETCDAAARRGLRELAASGVTAVGDIAAVEISYRALQDSGLRGVAYLETLGFKPERVERERDRLNAVLNQWVDSERVLVGISPHTPYTVGPRLWELLRKEFKPRVDRFSIHVSEILEEAAFLEGGWGPLRMVLRGAGLLGKGWKPPKMSPLEYVDSFGFVTRGTALVHGNFLTEIDRRLLAERQSGGSVCLVHCPRTHRFFRRLPFPLAELRKDGIPVALGTDSLASNDSLDMLEEMKTLHADQPGLPAGEILRMATLHGAQALALEETTGTLEREKSADLAVIDVSDSSPDAAPEERILRSSSRCVLTLVMGETVFSE